MRSIARAGLGLAVLTVIGVAGAGPASGSPPTLTATATFGRTTYVSGQAVSATLRIHNSGTSAAVGFHATDAGSGLAEIALDSASFERLNQAITIPGGATVSVSVTGHLGAPSATVVTFAGFVSDAQGTGVANFSASAPVTVRTATVSGQVYGDANSNGRADAGEGVSGARLTFAYRFGQNQYVITTGASGRFSRTLPLASYYLTGAGGGWTVIPRVVDVGAGGTQLSLRAVRPIGTVLKAALHFTRHTYAPGDTAHIVVTLTNTGSSTLRGIGAECAHAGNPEELRNTSAGWGALALDAPGVTILPHTTRTFDVTGTVPAAAQRAGQVSVACDFGYPGVEDRNRPGAQDVAKVPGLSGAIAGTVQSFPNGRGNPGVGLPNVRVVLVDASTCPVFTRTATTGADGTFRIGGVPAGAGYELYLYPPAGYKVVNQNPTPAFVLGNNTVNLAIEVARGTTTVPVVPTACATPTSTPAPTSSSAGGVLANTGTDPAVPAEVGSAAVLGGLLLVGFGRRRPARHARR